MALRASTKGTMRSKYAAIFLLLAGTLAQAQTITSADALLRAMESRYSWYHTLTFTQKSTTYNPDGTTKVETWHEAASLPGKLRIDIGPPAENNGYLMVGGNLSIVKSGQVDKTIPYVNILLVLGFDAYTQPADTTEKVLKAEGYDLSRFHEDTWEGKPAYVVGADKGDLKSKQFWIEKESLLFVRVIAPSRQDATKMDDIRFTNYQKLGKAWVAARVEVHSEGRLAFSEDYTEIQGDPKLDATVFDPAKFSSTHWEKH
jgi:hypothetical protein